MDLITISNLSYRYPDGTWALQDLSLTVPEGKKIALLGPNGAGKSTLLLHLNGIHQAQRGIVALRGEALGEKNALWARSQVGLVFQDPDDQVFSSTVWEDVAFGPTNLGLPKAEVEVRCVKALEQVGMLAHRDKAPYHLSYGQKKRVAIAGVLAMEPAVMILDEPDAFLDPAGQDALMAILDDLHQQGTTILIATHDVDLAVHWAEQVIILKEGRCLAQGSPRLLTDEGLVAEASLRLPLLTQLFQKLPGWQGEKPAALPEALAALERWKKQGSQD